MIHEFQLWDLAYEEIRKTIKENNGSPVLLTEAALMACDRNKDTRYYLLGRLDDDFTNIRDNSEIKNKDLLKLNKSWKLRQILVLIRNDSCMQIVEEKPVSIRWVKEDKLEHQKEKLEKQCLMQVSVPSDTPVERAVNKKENNYSTHIQDSFVDNPILIIPPCDGCDGCDATNEKEKIPIDKYPSINSPLTSIEDAGTTNGEDKKTDSTSKYDCLLNNSNVSTNTAATTEFDAIQVIPNNPEIKKLLPPSHSSHSSHSGLDENTTKYHLDLGNDIQQAKIKDEDDDKKDHDFIGMRSLILKHSLYAEIYSGQEEMTLIKTEAI